MSAPDPVAVSLSPTAVLIVCERRGDWAAAWRQALLARGTRDGQPPIRLVETRSLADCRRELAANPAATVAVELTDAGADNTLSWLAAVEHEFPAAVVVVMAARRLAGYEELVRELGVAWFTTAPRQLLRLVSVFERHAARLPATEMSVEERVAAQLPWG